MDPFDCVALEMACHTAKTVVARWANCRCSQFDEGRPMYALCNCPLTPEPKRPLTPKEKAERRKKMRR